MLIDDKYRKCVTFVYTKDRDAQEKYKPAATAFFVKDDSTCPSDITFAVTAVHVVNGARKEGSLYLRIHTAAGEYDFFEVTADHWLCHNSTDVAAVKLRLPEEQFCQAAVPISIIATDEYVSAKGVGIGDDILFLGLFSPHPGQSHIQPISRFGRISLMPHEQERIDIRLDPATDPLRVPAYLIEGVSWGGQSGSPAFIYFRPDRTPGLWRIDKDVEYRLLGIVHGHQDISRPVAIHGDASIEGSVSMNAGIAVVIPAQAILETLRLTDDRETVVLP